MLLDRKKLRRKVLLDLSTKPLIIVPFLIGASALIAIWTFSITSAVLQTIAALALLGSLGLFLTTFFLGDESIAKNAIHRLKVEEEKREEKELDDLDAQLVKDRDSRTQQMLRDLRELASKFKDRNLIGDIEANLLFDIVSGVHELFDNSVKMLHRTLELHRTAIELGSNRAKHKIVERREEILTDISKNIEQIGDILAEIQSMDSENSSDTSKLRTRLIEDIRAAKRVKERLSGVESDLNAHINELHAIREKVEVERA